MLKRARAVAALIALALLSGCSAHTPAPIVTHHTGDRLPAVRVHDVATGNSVPVLETDKPAVVAFLTTQPESQQDESRSIAVVLTSLALQNTSSSLRIVIVDESANVNASDLVNTLHDWGLGSVLFASDRSRTAENAWGVTSTPKIVVVDASGKLTDQFDHYVPPAALASVIPGDQNGS